MDRIACAFAILFGCVTTRAHDARVSELLTANSREVERRRMEWRRCQESINARDRVLMRAHHLATMAEAYMGAVNESAKIEEMGGEPDHDAQSDLYRALRSAIYEFRKRAGNG